MPSLKDVGERALIERMIGRIGRCSGIGPGDDAACIDVDGVKIVAATDIVTKERHMPKGMTMEQFGWTAAAVNFSDIASMGASPFGILAAVSLPPETDENVFYDIMDGMDQCAEFCGTEVIGGDTKSGPVSICGTALGVCRNPPLTRSGARPGDIIAVTGALGSAGAGWYAAMNGIDEKDAISSVMMPIPKVKEGLFLSDKRIATACMDISDGLSTTAAAICISSNVGMDIMWESLPKGAGVETVAKKLKISEKRLMLDSGGEYELLFTFRKDDLDTLHSSDIDFSVIGVVTSGDSAYLTENGRKERMENRGYEHFTAD